MEKCEKKFCLLKGKPRTDLSDSKEPVYLCEYHYKQALKKQNKQNKQNKNK